jgi:hypothetical protein
MCLHNFGGWYRSRIHTNTEKIQITEHIRGSKQKFPDWVDNEVNNNNNNNNKQSLRSNTKCYGGKTH